MSGEPTDAEVIARVLAGDTEGFGMLVDRYQDEFARYARYMMGGVDEAADVIQESLVRAYRFLGRCGDPENFKGWLFRIVSNQCKTALARRRRRRWESLSQEAGEVPAPHDPGADAEAADVRRKVHRALGQLSEEYREVLILKYVEGLSLPEMAALLSVRIPALKMRLLRGRRALLAKLEGVVS